MLCVCVFQDSLHCNTWLPVYNHDLGGSEAYDAAILELNEALGGSIWCDNVRATAPQWVAAQWPSAPTAAAEGSACLMIVHHPRIAAILVCWERETAGGWPLPGGTAM